MFSVIDIMGSDGKALPVEFLANAATPRRYKAVFGEDLLQKFVNAKTEEGGKEYYNIDFLHELAFIMAFQAKAKDDKAVRLDKLNYNSFLNWLEAFDSMAIEDKASDIIDVYLGNSKTSSEAKKNIEEQRES